MERCHCNKKSCTLQIQLLANYGLSVGAVSRILLFSSNEAVTLMLPGIGMQFLPPAKMPMSEQLYSMQTGMSVCTAFVLYFRWCVCAQAGPGHAMGLSPFMSRVVIRHELLSRTHSAEHLKLFQTITTIYS